MFRFKQHFLEQNLCVVDFVMILEDCFLFVFLDSGWTVFFCIRRQWVHLRHSADCANFHLQELIQLCQLSLILKISLNKASYSTLALKLLFLAVLESGVLLSSNLEEALYK